MCACCVHSEITAVGDGVSGLGVAVAVGVFVAVGVAVAVLVAVGVFAAIGVAVGVCVAVGGTGVLVAGMTGVTVGVFVGEVDGLPHTILSVGLPATFQSPVSEDTKYLPL